jgi:beta-glucanase (GH16 family)
VNNANWSFDIGDGCAAGICGWGNQEKQYYTNTISNVALNDSGQLAITATTGSSGLTCYYGLCLYSSAKIKTKLKIENRYGRFEARIKLPNGQGLWPAFWMLGNNFPATSWPNCGEIDIMEYRGSQSNTVSSALHGPSYSGNTPIAHRYVLPVDNFTSSFHVFAVEWESDQIRFYVDDTLHYTATKSMIEQHGNWVFDHPFFIVLNLAVGGQFDGDPASKSIFPATMLVDYVRIYARSGVYLPLVIREA